MFAAGVAMFVVQTAYSLPSRWSPGLAKVIVRTVQFGPAEPFFPGLCCIYRADEQSWRRAPFRSRGRGNSYDPWR